MNTPLQSNLPEFPALAIGASGNYRGETITRVSPRLYSRSKSILKYSKSALVAIMDPSPIGSRQRAANGN